jgi:hypothetical protein
VVSTFGFVDLHLHTKVLSHNFLQVIARVLKDSKPTIFPVSNAGEPSRAPATGPALRSPTVQVHAPVPIESLSLPNFLDRLFPDVGKKLRCAKGDVLAA